MVTTSNFWEGGARCPAHEMNSASINHNQRWVYVLDTSTRLQVAIGNHSKKGDYYENAGCESKNYGVHSNDGIVNIWRHSGDLLRPG